jgi:ABC-type branched-subunit amino acid transport system substrate-binding protein
MRYAAKIVTTLLLFSVAALLLSNCGGDEKAAPASENVPGVTDTQILLGTHLPMSGNAAAAYAPVADGLRAYFNFINDTEGGVYGRKIKLIVGDDHYNPPDTLEVVRKEVEQDHVFGIVMGLGDETHSAVWKYLEDNGIPDMFIASGLRKWTDPVVSTRFIGIPDYQIEAEMLGEYVKEHYDGAKVGVLRENNEYGEDGLIGLKKGLEGSNAEIVAIESCEATVADTSAQTQRLRSAGADVVVSVAGPLMSASLVQTARSVISWDAPILVSGVDVSQIFIDLAGPENAEGVISVVFGHQVYETDVPGVQQHLEIMAKYGGGALVSNFTLYGASIGEMTVEVLKRTGQDLTREKFVKAAESIRGWMCSTCVAPVNMSPTDHRPQEIEMYNRVEGGKWVTFGDLVNFETTRD